MPALRVTVDILSGRPNPVLELSVRASAALFDLLGNARRLEKGEPALPPAPTLGYRGLLVEQVGKPLRGLPSNFRVANDLLVVGERVLKLESDAFERELTRSAQLRKLGVERKVAALVGPEVERFRERCRHWPWRRWPPRIPVRVRCRCAPLWEPAWWNNDPQRLGHNNCYNYSTNHRTDTFRILNDGSQPGAAAGAMYTSITGPAVRTAAIADGVINLPGANNKCPGEGHLVALVIWPGVDFHWYRKGRNGFWTHKPGSTPATDVDNSGHPIPDPRTADRGGYTQFATFMQVMGGHVKIK